MDDTNIEITVRPRPDLQVLEVNAPAVVDPGQTIAVEFVVINQGTIATTVPNWTDRVYLSLDGFISGCMSHGFLCNINTDDWDRLLMDGTTPVSFILH